MFQNSDVLQIQNIDINGDERKKLGQMTYEDLFHKLGDLLKGKHNHSLPRKSSKISIEARESGNVLYHSKKHNQATHAKILSYYTKSIAYAEENSEELAKGYSNRSALSMHVHKYRECLIDIERANEITKSDELKKKLAERKHNCLLQLKKVNKNEQKPPELFYFKPSKEIACASELIRLEYNDKYGRHVVATQDISPGTVIVVEKSFALFPIMEYRYLNCSHCLSLAWTGIPCQNCTVALYCSEKCREEALQQYHDIECSLLPYFDFLGFFHHVTITALTVRLFIKIIKSESLANIIREANFIDQNNNKQLQEFFHNNFFQYDKFKSFYNLTSSELNVLKNKKLCRQVYELLIQNSKIFNKTIEDTNSKTINQNILEKMRNIIINNSFTFHTDYGIKDLEDTDLGYVTTIFCSLFNHSCVGNVKRSFTNNQEILLYTSNYVRKGQQLFINYGITDLMTKKERHSLLKNYNFICECLACKENCMCVISPQDLGPINYKMYEEFDKFHVGETFLKIVDKDYDKRFFTKKSFQDVKKIMNITNKYYKDLQAYGLLYSCVSYLMNYYDAVHGIRHDIPNNC